MAHIQFAYGTQAKYDELVLARSVDENTLYFITDHQKIYKGATFVSGNNIDIVEEDNLPEVANAIDNMIYVVKAKSGSYTAKLANSDKSAWIDLISNEINVNTSQVKIAKNIVVTTATGNFKPGDELIVDGEPGDGQIKVTDMQNLLELLLSKDVNPVTTQPSASVALSGAGEKEVGTQFTPNYTAKLSPGSYNVQGQGQQSTNIKPSKYTISDTKSHSASTESGSFEAFTVEDSTNYSVSATINYNDGAIPNTFLGNPYPAGQIKAGSKSATSQKVTGFRNCWWGFKGSNNLISNPSNISKEEVKALGNSNKNKPSQITASDMQQIFIVVPSNTPGTNSLEITDTGTGLPLTVHNQGDITLQIGGVNDYSPISYKVFCSNNASPAPGNTTYKFTWK